MIDPRKLVLKRKPSSPGLTGADLEQAKAEADVASADKGYATARATKDWDRESATAQQGASAAANLANIANARNPETADALDRALALLRQRGR